MSSSELWYSTDSEDDARKLKLKRRRIRDASNPLELPVEKFVQYFRVSKDLFIYLLQVLESKIPSAVGATSVLPIIKLAASLRFFAEGKYQKGVGDRSFGLAQPTTSRALSTVINVIESEICPSVIQFPLREEKQSSVKSAVSEKTGFPGVIGCVDGTHVRIFCPKRDQLEYCNREGYHSLNVMMVCDHNMCITYVDATHPGSCDDSFIWNASTLNQVLSEKYERGERSSWLLGDAGYPLKPYLITPFRDIETQNNSNERIKFNECHERARSTIGRTISILKNTFKCISGARKLHYTPEKCIQIINVCCALHNLRIRYKMKNHEWDNIADTANEPHCEQEDSPAAISIRDEIMNSIVLCS